MVIEKRVVYEQTVKRGYIEVRQENQIWEDEVFLSKSYDRHIIHPGQDTSQEDPETQRIAVAIHTPEVIAAFLEAERARQSKQ